MDTNDSGINCSRCSGTLYRRNISIEKLFINNYLCSMYDLLSLLQIEVSSKNIFIEEPHPHSHDIVTTKDGRRVEVMYIEDALAVLFPREE